MALPEEVGKDHGDDPSGNDPEIFRDIGVLASPHKAAKSDGQHQQRSEEACFRNKPQQHGIGILTVEIKPAHRNVLRY